MKNLAKLEIAVGVLTGLTGLLYFFGVFGRTESEVNDWAFLAFVLGGIFVFIGINKSKVNIYLKSLLILFLMLIQTPAIFLWFKYNGRPISDGTPYDPFVAQWIFATPHILIAVICTVLIVSLYKRNMVD